MTRYEEHKELIDIMEDFLKEAQFSDLSVGIQGITEYQAIKIQKFIYDLQAEYLLQNAISDIQEIMKTDLCRDVCKWCSFEEGCNGTSCNPQWKGLKNHEN